MTRQWQVPVQIMCQEHLCGEHVECHQAVGTLRNHQYGEEVMEGLAEKGFIETKKLTERHDALAAEMRRRDYDHDSAMNYVDEIDIGRVDPHANLAELVERCDDCRERFEERTFTPDESDLSTDEKIELLLEQQQ